MTSSESRRVQPRVQERRRNPRLSVTALIYLTVAPNNGGFLLDLSESGMCISLANPLVISKNIRFSFPLVERRMIEGTGRICWVSESGRKAGVQFVECSNESLEQIRQWLVNEDPSTERDGSRRYVDDVNGSGSRNGQRSPGANEINSPAGGQLDFSGGAGIQPHRDSVPSKREGNAASVFGHFPPTPPRPDAAIFPEAADRAASQHDGGAMVPDTPLFFLPRKKEEAGDLLSDASGEVTQLGSEERTGENTGFDGAVFRSALVAGPAQQENEKRKKSGLGKAVVRTALLLAFMFLCFTIYKYPGSFTSLERFVPSVYSGVVSSPAGKAKQTGAVDRGTYSLRSRHNVRRSTRARHASAFSVPGGDGGSVSRQAIASGLQMSGQPGAGTDPSPSESKNAVPGENSQSFSAGDGLPNVGAAAPQPVEAPMVEFSGLMATLRNDGALVEEGGLSSSSADPGNRPSVPERIVLDVVVGKNGEVKGVTPVSSPDSKLAGAVIQSVKKWRYMPLYEKGKPVEFTTRITVDFSIPPRKP